MGISWTKKQQRFVEEYCVDFNATQAAIRAGYSEKTAYSIGHENLTKPEIKEAIENRLDELSMSAAEATKRMSDMGRGSMRPFLKVTDDNDVIIDLASDEAWEYLHLIREVKQEETVLSDEDGEMILKRRMKVKLHDAKDALKQIMKAHGAFGAKGTEDDPVHTKHALEWGPSPEAGDEED